MTFPVTQHEHSTSDTISALLHFLNLLDQNIDEITLATPPLTQISITSRLMNTLSFNAIPNDPYSHIGCNPEIDRVRSLIETLENYGVKKKFLFQLDDLYKMRNIPKVTRCIEEIEKLAMLEEHIVSDCLPSNKVYCNF